MNKKYTSFLYNPPKPFHEMSLRELCNYNNIINKLNKIPLNKIKIIEKWSNEKRERKFKKYLLRKTRKQQNICLKKRPRKKTRRLKLNKKYFLKLNTDY